MKPEDLSLTDLAQQACLEEFLDERVISPSAAAGVAAPTEQAEPIGFGHESPSFDVVDFTDNCGETWVHGLKEGDPHQELLGGWLEVAHNLLGEVVVEIARGTAQSFDELSNFYRGSIPQGGLNELEAGGPPIGSPCEIGQEISIKRAVVDVPKQALGLAHVEAKVLRPQLDDGTG